jgi:hypothetical protein
MLPKAEKEHSLTVSDILRMEKQKRSQDQTAVVIKVFTPYDMYMHIHPLLMYAY